jgi:tRNA/rRNA methyltransferase
MEDSPESSLAVILVETSESLNIGSVARVMMNFGFSDLRLVAPRNYSLERARITACGGAELLDSLKQYASLREAIADRRLVVGFSSRSGKNRGRFVAFDQWIGTLKECYPSKLGLVFGPEDHGLLQEHVEQCATTLFIPTSAKCPSMNLASAVGVVLYALSIVPKKVQSLGHEEPVEWSQYAQLDRAINELGGQSRFFNKGTPEDLPGLITNIFKRIPMNQRELKILTGFIATAVKRFKDHMPL